MTARKSIIHKIMASKNKPHLDFNIKHKTEAFTNNLFYTLFDANACVEKKYKTARNRF